MPDPLPLVPSCPVCNGSSSGFASDGSCVTCNRNASIAVLLAQIQVIKDSGDPDTTSLAASALFVDRKPILDDCEDASSLAQSSLRHGGASGAYRQNPTVISAAGSLPRTTTFNSSLSIASGETSFVASILDGCRPLAGSGSELQNFGVILVKEWGLAGADTPFHCLNLPSNKSAVSPP